VLLILSDERHAQEAAAAVRQAISLEMEAEMLITNFESRGAESSSLAVEETGVKEP
jgi:hypothetical protein